LILNARNALASAPGVIRLHAQRNEGDSIELTVSDNGPGFPAILLNSAGRPFLSGHENGTGLGLAVTRRFINGLGGQLSLTNQPGGGARVSLRIPCPTASEST
jgi:signal transduction histidine kinase